MRQSATQHAMNDAVTWPLRALQVPSARLHRRQRTGARWVPTGVGGIALGLGLWASA
jgi:hypothetical protein